MTIPIERSHAIDNTRLLLLALLDRKLTPKVPLPIRLWARRCLKHYPWAMDMDKVRHLAPEVFGSMMEYKGESMPYKSDAQRRYFHSAAAKGKISPKVVKEFDKASKGKSLPERIKSKKKRSKSGR